MTSTYDEVFSEVTKGGVLASDLVGLVLGPEISSGESRAVFVNNFDSSTVIKMERRSRSFNNCYEWDIWNNFEGTPMEKWLAPCVSISACGIYLVQMKTTVAASNAYPEKIPKFFTDLKYSNWGMFEDRMVCHDYANSTLYQPDRLKKLVKAEWWKERGDVNR